MSEIGKALAEAVGAVTSDPVYGRAHGATVRYQHEDDSIDVECDTAAIGGIQRVPLRVGIVGARVLVTDGARVRLAFEGSDERPGGDPSKPYAFGIDGDPSADKGIARVGDLVDIGMLSYAGPGVLTWTHPDPTHVPPQYAGVPIPLQGIIKTGSAAVLLRGDS